MKRFKRVVPQLCAILIVCVLACAGYIHQAVFTDSSGEYSKTVILDAGHGGFDGGAVAPDGTVEKHINLMIAKKLKSMLSINGYKVIMTRYDDIGTDTVEGSIAARKKSDLENRLKLMQDNPDALYVSIHLNKFTTSSASGAQVFYTPNFRDAEVLGECIQSSIIKKLQPDNVRVAKQGYKSTFLLSNAKVPAVIVECGFLSNKEECERLQNDRYRGQIAFAIMCGINDFFNTKE